MPTNEHPAINWRSRIVKYGKIAASEITPHPNNPRKHPQLQREAVAASFDELGQIAPILINVNNGYLIDGEERSWLALGQGDDVEVDAIWVDLSEEEHNKALVYFDATGDLATYDAERLNLLLADVNSDNSAIQQMIADLKDVAVSDMPETGEQTGDAAAQMNRAEELKTKYGVERGQLWLIGRHRLLCGDSYSQEDIDRLMDGKVADMLHTDPPYGINIVKPSANGSAAAIGGAKPFGSTGETHRKGKTAVAFRNSGKVGGGRGDESSHHVRPQDRDVGRGNPANIIQSNLYPVIEGDDRPFDPAPFIDFAPVVIMWGANYYADKLPPKACWITWDKREDITRNNFADCELAWTNQNSPARCFHHLWNGLHKGSQNGERRIHPTEKPVALFAEIGEMFCSKGLWVDLFAGSGAQIVAAEQTGATCYALEYEPLYVACVLERLKDLGLEPQLAETT